MKKLFLIYSFLVPLRTLFEKFQLRFAFIGDIFDFFKGGVLFQMSAQVKEMWLSAVAAVLLGVLTQRNACKFEDQVPDFSRLCFGIVGWFTEASLVVRGTMFNNVRDLMIIKGFGVQCHPRKSPKIVEGRWFPPLEGWIKCNTDGVSKIPSHQAVGGGLFS